MDERIADDMKDVLWVSHTLYDRGKVSGSTGNISYRSGNYIYISCSGSCMGRLKEQDFSIIDLMGNHISGPKPSKEWPLHLSLYKKDDIQCVLHTHSFYITLWSCLEHETESDIIPRYTPYLKMKLGAVKLVPYAEPGSEELFALFASKVDVCNGYILKNHGAIVGGKSILDTFYSLEELEESARIAWNLKDSVAASLIATN